MCATHPDVRTVFVRNGIRSWPCVADIHSTYTVPMCVYNLLYGLTVYGVWCTHSTNSMHTFAVCTNPAIVTLTLCKRFIHWKERCWYFRQLNLLLFNGRLEVWKDAQHLNLVFLQWKNFEFYKKLNILNPPLRDVSEIQGDWLIFLLVCVYREVIWRNEIVYNRWMLNKKKLKNFNSFLGDVPEVGAACQFCISFRGCIEAILPKIFFCHR